MSIGLPKKFIAFAETGNIIYAIIADVSSPPDRYLDGDEFDTLVGGSPTNEFTEVEGVPGTYEFDTSAFMRDGTYLITIFRQIGENPDPDTDAVVARDSFHVKNDQIGDSVHGWGKAWVPPSVSIYLSSLGEGLLYNPGTGAPVERIPNGAPGEILTFFGPGLKPQPQLPAEVQAFTTGSSLAANPVMTNPSARYVAIDPGEGIHSFSPLDDSTTTNWLGFWPKGKAGAPLYIRVGGGGAIQTSPTGAAGTWTTQASGTTNNLNSVMWDGTRFIAVGNGGVFVYSTDGEAWSTFTYPAGQPFTSICRTSDGLYVATSTFNRTLFSTGDPTVSGNWSGTVNASGSYYACVADGSTVYIVGETIRSSTDGANWTTRLTPTSTLYSVVRTAETFVASGASGVIYTSPTGTTWTTRTSGTTESLRLFVANGRVYAVGSGGVSLESSDNGATWVPGPSTGVSVQLRHGVEDPNDPRRAIVVGDSGVTLAAKYPFISSVYDTPAKRADREDALGSAANAYSDTPVEVTIAGQIRFQTGIIGVADVPLTFDVVTIQDIIFALFVGQNPSLTPGPYFGFNAVYDFGADDRWEYGQESDNSYASLLLMDSATGTWYLKMSDGPGNAGDPITWQDCLIVGADGSLTLPSLAGTGSRAVMADANGKLSAP